MFPWTSISACPAASPCTRLSRARSTTSGSDFHDGFCLPQVRAFRYAYLAFGQDRRGSPRFLGASVSIRAVLSDPAEVSGDHRLWRSPTMAFQVFDLVGPRMYHEAPSLHLRYGPDVALPTLNSCRYLHAPKARFPVGWLSPLPEREFHPLEAPGLAWRTKEPM